MEKVSHSPKRICGLLLLALLLSACSTGGLFSGDMMYAPHRSQVTDATVYRSALTALAEGDRAGRITLSEAELSSLLTAALAGRSGEGGMIRDVQVWLEPDTVYLKIMLREGAIPRLPGDVAVNVEGGLRTADNRLQFELERAGVGVIPIASPALLDLVEAQLKIAVRRLVDRASPLGVEVDTGTITIDVP